MSQLTRKNIVLLGIGHTNAHIVNSWSKDPIPGYALICINNYPSATYSGMLPGALGGQFSEQSMRIDLAPLVERAGAQLVLADTQGLDLSKRSIQFADREPLTFEILSIGVGSMPVGWTLHAESPLVVPIKPMQTFLLRLHKRLALAQSNRNERLNVAIVGGGVASVEIALCLKQELLRHNKDSTAAIEIFTSSQQVAEGMRPRSIRHISALLRSRDIGLHTGRRVTQVGSDHILTEDGNSYKADCVIWSTGAAAPPVLGKLGLIKDEHGFIATKSSLQSVSDPRIFAVGDSGTVLESPSPKAGVYAVRQSPILWHNLQAIAAGGALRTFNPQRDFLKLLNTGDSKALMEYGFFTTHARWCLYLKNWIDRSFVSTFQVKLPS